MRRLMTAALAAFLLSLPGCAFSIGGGSTEEVQCRTWGQQLLDLKKAHDEGALTQKEYEEAKRKIVRAALKN